MVMMILFVSLPQNKNVVTYDTEPLSEDDVKQMWSLNRDTDWIDMYVGLGKVGVQVKSTFTFPENVDCAKRCAYGSIGKKNDCRQDLELKKKHRKRAKWGLMTKRDIFLVYIKI